MVRNPCCIREGKSNIHMQKSCQLYNVKLILGTPLSEQSVYATAINFESVLERE